MKVKTCEEYVLQRVEDLENENEALKAQIDTFREKLEQAVSTVEKLESYIGRNSRLSSYIAHDGDRSFNIEGPWKKYDLEMYNLVKACIMKYGNPEDAVEEVEEADEPTETEEKEETT
jgi:hypothetical protein